MRRAEREITDRSQMKDILNQGFSIRIALVDEGEPYLVAMNYAYLDGFIYLHSAIEGRKIVILNKNNKVAFQTEIDAEIVQSDIASNCTTKYRSIFGTGRCFFIQDTFEKTKVLDAFMQKYTGKSDSNYPANVLGRTAIIKIAIESITGKKSCC